MDLVRLQYLGQVVLSVYGLRHSFTAITKLQKYEQTTKKMAKWSKEVENQLSTTRKTQGSGLVAVCVDRTYENSNLTTALQIVLSLLAALTMLLARDKLPSVLTFTISPAMLLIVTGARHYIRNFWTPTQDSRGKDVGSKVPLLPSMEDYNVAVQKTEDLLKVLEYLEYSWLITSFFSIIPTGAK